MSADDYANELTLFAAGDLDQSLWAKHLIEAEGDAEKAKWKYLKERISIASNRIFKPIETASEDDAIETGREKKANAPDGNESPKSVAGFDPWSLYIVIGLLLAVLTVALALEFDLIHWGPPAR